MGDRIKNLPRTTYIFYKNPMLQILITRARRGTDSSPEYNEHFC